MKNLILLIILSRVLIDTIPTATSQTQNKKSALFPLESPIDLSTNKISKSTNLSYPSNNLLTGKYKNANGDILIIQGEYWDEEITFSLKGKKTSQCLESSIESIGSIFRVNLKGLDENYDGVEYWYEFIEEDGCYLSITPNKKENTVEVSERNCNNYHSANCKSWDGVYEKVIMPFNNTEVNSVCLGKWRGEIENNMIELSIDKFENRSLYGKLKIDDKTFNISGDLKDSNYDQPCSKSFEIKLFEDGNTELPIEVKFVGFQDAQEINGRLVCKGIPKGAEAFMTINSPDNYSDPKIIYFLKID